MTLSEEERRAREVLVIDENYSRGTDPGSTSRIPGWGANEDLYGTGWWLDYNDKASGAASLHMAPERFMPLADSLKKNVDDVPARRIAIRVVFKSETILPVLFIDAVYGPDTPYQMGIRLPNETVPTGQWQVATLIAAASPAAASTKEIHLWGQRNYTTLPSETDEIKIDSLQVWLINHDETIDLEELTNADEVDDDGEISGGGLDPMSPENNAPVHTFTRAWWDSLPEYIRAADRVQQPPVPLLRFLDGAGRQAGEVRDINTDLWDGTLLDPGTAPDRMIPWIAYLMGFTPQQRNHPPAVLRRHLQHHIAEGSPQPGTREYIAEAVRELLPGGAQIQILASSTYQHTLVIGVHEEDITGGNQLTNPSFETGDFTGWPAANNAFEVIRHPDAAHGDHVVRLNDSTGWRSLQALGEFATPVSEGEVWRLSGRIRNIDVHSGSFQAMFNGTGMSGDQATVNTRMDDVPTNEWTLIETTLTIPAGVTNIWAKFQAHQNLTGSLLLDDCILENVTHNHAWLENQIRQMNITPAGHAIRVQDIRTTWDAWETLAGETWAEKEQNIPDWGTSDTGGATFE